MGKYSKALEALDAEGLIRFVQDLVRIDSVFDPDVEGADESRVTDFVADFLSREGFEVHLEEASKIFALAPLYFLHDEY